MGFISRLIKSAVFIQITIVLSFTMAPAHGETLPTGTCVRREVSSRLIGEGSSSFSLLDFEDLATQSPELYRFTKSKAIERILKTQPVPYKMIENNIALATHKAGDISFSINARELNTHLTVTREESRLEVKINSINLNQTESKSQIEYGKRNDSLNMGFPRLLAAISAGVDRQIKADPRLQKITFVGSYVINQHLADQLRRFGFVSTTKGDMFLSRAKRDPSAVFGGLVDFMAQILGTTFLGPKSNHSKVIGKTIKGSAATAATVLKIKSAIRNRGVGQTWQLDLDLVRPANK